MRGITYAPRRGPIGRVGRAGAGAGAHLQDVLAGSKTSQGRTGTSLTHSWETAAAFALGAGRGDRAGYQ